MRLIDRIQEPDVQLLPDWKVAEVLTAPDERLPLITEWTKSASGYEAVVEALGPAEGAAFLESLELFAKTNSQLKWALRIIEKRALDLSLESVRAGIMAYTQPPFNLLTPAQAEKVFALAKLERHPSWAEFHGVEVNARTVGLARGGA